MPLHYLHQSSCIARQRGHQLLGTHSSSSAVSPLQHVRARTMEPADAVGTSAATNRSSRLNKTLYGLPVHCLTERDLATENARQVLSGFHRPTNAHDRFMASLTTQSRSILRDIQRPEAFSSSSSSSSSSRQGTAAAMSGGSSRQAARPATAPPASAGRNDARQQHRHRQQHSSQPASALQAALSATTAKGVPCWSVEAVLCADVVDGRPAPDGGAGGSAVKLNQQWRLARVKAYKVPPSRYGHGEAGARAFHQTYSFYKQYGFAGRGAATSWAGSPTTHAHAQTAGRSSSSSRSGISQQQQH